MAKQSKVHGEGDYEAARRYRQRSENYVAHGDAEQAARDAAPKSSREAEDMKAAEAAGKKRAKGEDPAFKRRAAPRASAGVQPKKRRNAS
jgi:hypothetical protein